MDRSRICSSHKRPSRLSSSPGDDRLCGLPCHDDYAREDGPGPKRPKHDSQIPRTVLFHAEDPLGFVSNSFNNANRGPFDISPYLTDQAPFQALPSPSRSAYLNFGSQPFQQQIEGTADSTVGTSISYTATDGTLSPRSLSRQELADTNDGQLQSSTPMFEHLFADSEDFGLDSTKEWPGCSFESPNIPGSPDSFGKYLLSGFASGVEDIHESFADRHHENELVEVGSPSFAASTYMVNGRSNALPWAHPLAVQSMAINSNRDESSNQTAISAKMLQPIIPCDSKFKAIQPFKKFSTTSSTHPWSASIPGIQYSQPLLMVQSKPELPKRSGIRKGPLLTEQADGALKMRKHGACFSCRLLNMKCSMETPCGPCKRPRQYLLAQPLTQQTSPSLSTRVLCFRAPLAKYTDMMFPDFVTLRFKEEMIADLVKKTARFTNNQILVEMSSGPGYPPIPLVATEFRCLDPKFLAFDYVIPNQDTVNQYQKYTRSYSPPIGLYGVGSEELRSKCLAHIDSIICKKRHIGEARYDDTSFITHKVLEAVNTYRRSIPGNGSCILTKAVKIQAMHYFMSRIITLTKNSAETAVKRLQRPQQMPFDEALQVSQVLTSALLNLQVKKAMLGLLQELTTEVFKSFEKAMMKHRGDSTLWADNFCVMLCFCISIEAVQVSNDSISMALLCKNPNSSHDRTETFLKIENGPFRELKYLFHAVYKTERAKGPGCSVGFNPIRFGFPISTDGKFTPQMTALVNDMKDIMKLHGAELAKASQKPSFDNPKPDIRTHHMDFRKRNSGRLVSQFLMSFL